MQGNGSVVNALISEMNKGNFDASSVSEEWQDIKVVTTLLKRFLKQLPDSLIIEGMYHDFITAARAPTDEGRVQRIKELVGQLPPAHFHTLRHFTVHLATIEKHSEHNKVSLIGVSQGKAAGDQCGRDKEVGHCLFVMEDGCLARCSKSWLGTGGLWWPEQCPSPLGMGGGCHGQVLCI